MKKNERTHCAIMISEYIDNFTVPLSESLIIICVNKKMKVIEKSHYEKEDENK